MPITTYAQIQKKLDDIARQSLEKIALEVQALWENYIQTRFYDMYNPQIYKRSYDLLNSILVSNIYKSGTQWAISIFMDDSKANYLDDTPEDVWLLASDGFHGNKSIRTEGRFYDELIADLRSGTFYNEFSRILQTDMGLKIRRK